MSDCAEDMNGGSGGERDQEKREGADILRGKHTCTDSRLQAMYLEPLASGYKLTGETCEDEDLIRLSHYPI